MDGLERLQRLARWLRIALLVYIAINALAMVGGGFLVSWELSVQHAQPEVTFSILLNFAGNAVLLVASLLFLAWLYRARVNLSEMGVEHLARSPGWTIGWFLVPFANAVMPLRIMGELYHRSQGEDQYQTGGSVELVNSWWGCAIAGNLLTIALAILLAIDMVPGVILLTPPGVNTGLAIVALGLLSAAAFCLYRLVRRITAAQMSLMAVSRTFA